YGVSPFEQDPARDGLVPALRWTSRVAAIRDLAPGDSAGYGRRLVAAQPTRIALVPVGYADGYPRPPSRPADVPLPRRRRARPAPGGNPAGYPRPASGRADVLIRGRRRRVAATVSMDQLSAIVDDDVALGDEVVLVGSQGDERVGMEELGANAGTIGYEICC